MTYIVVLKQPYYPSVWEFTDPGKAFDKYQELKENQRKWGGAEDERIYLCAVTAMAGDNSEDVKWN